MPDPASASSSSGLIAPFVLQCFGPGSWWIVWVALTLLSPLMIVPLLLAPLAANAAIDRSGRRRNSLSRRC